jgi:hypothetical protein
VLLKMVAHSLAFGALLGLLLFLPAGTLAWPQAWVLMALFIGCSEAIGVWLKKTDPGPARREDEVADQRRPEIQRPSGDERDLGSFHWVVLVPHTSQSL